MCDLDIVFFTADTGVIQTIGRLDFESIRNYTLNVSARDNGATPRFTFISVPVNVLDVNDWTPEFEFSTYAVNVLENITVRP